MMSYQDERLSKVMCFLASVLMCVRIHLPPEQADKILQDGGERAKEGEEKAKAEAIAWCSR